MGNDAKNCTEIGELKETDLCCRMHDLCPYKFTRKNRQHNGFNWSWRKIYTLSHCQCDLMFKNCLHEEPIKTGSPKIWHSFNTLGIKCYSFFPCSNGFETFWNNLNDRETGSCNEGVKVVVFNSIDDYMSYLTDNLNKDELVLEKNLLSLNLDKFYIAKTMKIKFESCLNETYEFKTKVVDSFTNSFGIESQIQDIKTKEKDLDKIYQKEILETQSRRKYFFSKAKDALMKIFNILT